MKDISNAKDPALGGSLAALRRGSLRSSQYRPSNRHLLIVFRDGEITHILPRAQRAIHASAATARQLIEAKDEHLALQREQTQRGCSGN